MANLKLSEKDRAAIVLKKLISPGVKDPAYEHIDQLPFVYRDLIYAVLSEGKNKAEREARLKQELIARELIGDLDLINRADPSIDLSAIELKDSWNFSNLGEAYKPLPPLDWLVDGVIPRPSLSIAFGAPKSLKSLLVMDLAICVAGGKPWLPDLPDKGGGKGYQTRPTSVLWIDYENGSRRLKERFGALGRVLELPGETPLWFTSMPEPWLDASKPEAIGNLMRRIEAYQAKLVVVDHLSQIKGEADENSSEISPVMGHLRSVVEERDVALLLIHHQVKSPGKYGTSASDSLRGHGSILAATDLCFLIERNSADADEILIKPVAERGAPIGNLAAMFTYEQKVDGSKELETARFYGVAAKTLDLLGEAALIQILDEFGEMNQTKLRTALKDKVAGLGDDKARAIISRFERDGRIVVEHGSKGAKLYRLPEE